MPVALLGKKKRTILREKGLQQETALTPSAQASNASQRRMVVLHCLCEGEMLHVIMVPISCVTEVGINGRKQALLGSLNYMASGEGRASGGTTM